MRYAFIAACMLFPAPAFAQSADTAPAEQTAPAETPKLTTEDTTIGELLDNPATHAILEEHLPEVVASDQIDMARPMTLRAIQSYAPDMITDEKLAAIDAALARLPAAAE